MLTLLMALIACRTPPTETVQPGAKGHDVRQAHQQTANTSERQATDSGPLRVHLTIDDAGWQIERGANMTLSADDRRTHNQRLLKTLALNNIRASVFFNCDRTEPDDGIVELWRDAGHAVGNHTGSHLRASQHTPSAFLADTRDCQAQLSKRAPVQLFRYPYLSYGKDQADQEQIALGLGKLGLTNMPVSAVTQDWQYAYSYRVLLEQNKLDEAKKVRHAYVEHLLKVVPAAADLEQQLHGRVGVQTLLIHVNEINVEQLGIALNKLQQQGVVFVDAQTAMSDPAWTRPVTQFTPWGPPWAQRTKGNIEAKNDRLNEESNRASAQMKALMPTEEPWPSGTRPPLRTAEELMKALAAQGYAGSLSPAPWPKRLDTDPSYQPAGQVPAMVGAKLTHKRTISGVGVRMELLCASERERYTTEQMQALAAWTFSTDGRKRPARFIGLNDTDCVVSVPTIAMIPLMTEVEAIARKRPLTANKRH